MSVVEAIVNNEPLIWITTSEPERIISQIPSFVNTRDIFLMDPILGLTKWENETWKIVLVEKTHPLTGEQVQLPINDSSEAWMYIMQQPRALYLLRNAHVDIKDYYNLFSSFYGTYRKAVINDNYEELPLQIVAFSTEETVPDEIAAMTTQVSYSYPTDGELLALINLIQESYDKDVIGDQNVDKIVEASRGMTELEALETYMASIRSTQMISFEIVDRIRLDRLKKNSVLSIKKPTTTLDEVGGLDKAKELIKTASWIWKNQEEAEQYGLVPLRRILFVGLPGTGKSYICEAAAHELEMDLATVGVAKALDKYVGQSEKNMARAFASIKSMAPIAMWIDELGRDLSGGGSSDAVDGGTTARVHGTFLTEIQNLPPNVFLFAAANDLDHLAPEMLRADRFDKILFVGFPSFSERKEIFRLNLPDNGVDYDFDSLAAATPCFTGAEIKDLVASTKFEVSPKHKRHIVTEDIVFRVPRMKNRLWIKHKNKVIRWYTIAQAEYEWASTEQFQEAGAIIQGREPNSTVNSSTSLSKASLV